MRATLHDLLFLGYSEYETNDGKVYHSASVLDTAENQPFSISMERPANGDAIPAYTPVTCEVIEKVEPVAASGKDGRAFVTRQTKTRYMLVSMTKVSAPAKAAA